MLKRLNDALPELVLGIILYGIVVELAGVWFVTDKLRYTTGLVIGIALQWEWQSTWQSYFGMPLRSMAESTHRQRSLQSQFCGM